jgi:hypothetical protein
MRSAAILLVLMASACGGPGCITVPGPDVEPGLYHFGALRVHPDSVSPNGLPYADAESLSIELASDRSTAVLRYVRNGVSVHETWSITILD